MDHGHGPREFIPNPNGYPLPLLQFPVNRFPPKLFFLLLLPHQNLSSGNSTFIPSAAEEPLNRSFNLRRNDDDDDDEKEVDAGVIIFGRNRNNGKAPMKVELFLRE